MYKPATIANIPLAITELNKLFSAFQMGLLGANCEIAIVARMEISNTVQVASRKLLRCEGELRMPESVISEGLVLGGVSTAAT